MNDEYPQDRAGGQEPDESTVARFHYTMEHSPEAVFWLERSGRFTYVNRQACESIGYSRDEILTMHLWDIDPDFPQERWGPHWDSLRESATRTFETRHRRKDGVIIPVEVVACQIRFQGEEFHTAYVRDISERRRAQAEKARLEEQLQQSQKLEAIGTLAGGIAHDFNNMLGVIIGYTELLKTDVPDGGEAMEAVEAIATAAFRSRDIARQLLAFSRKQIIEPVRLDVDRHIENTLAILGRLIGENIELDYSAGAGLWNIRLDPAQLDQILINLAVNARDAMPDGGRLKISLSNQEIDESATRAYLGSRPGRYVRLSVQDTGTGMSKSDLARIFEPFFTTKEQGKGTGLGLATTYGIVTQNHGFMDVQSTPGRGSVFHVFFPRHDGDPARIPVEQAVAQESRSGNILLVEDDAMVRNMTTRMLESLGYTVFAVEDPLAAIAFCQDGKVPLDLLLTDMVMPRMGGIELAGRIAGLRAGIGVIFMSGYSSDICDRDGVLNEGLHFLGKPFKRTELAAKIEAVLGAPRTSER